MENCKQCRIPYSSVSYMEEECKLIPAEQEGKHATKSIFSNTTSTEPTHPPGPLLFGEEKREFRQPG